MTTTSPNSRPGDSSHWSDRAREFLAGLPQAHEGSERALAFRRLVAAAAVSPEMFRLLIAVYQTVATTDVLPYSLHDTRMIITSVTERIELLPIVRPFIEQYLARWVREQDPVFGLLGYIQELYELYDSRPSFASIVIAADGPAGSVKVEWKEVRKTESFDVAGERMGDEWQFLEKAAFEQVWYPVGREYRTHCVERAEFELVRASRGARGRGRGER